MKGIGLEELKKEMLNTPEAIQAYNEADRELAMIEMLHNMRENAGLTKAAVAEKMGVSPSSINRLEGNPLGASMKTLARYAAACGAKIEIRTL